MGFTFFQRFFVFLIISLLCICVSTTEGQYLNFFAGPKFPNYQKANVQLAYVDESPAPDVFYANQDLKNQVYYSLGVSYDNFKHERTVYLNIIGNLYVGELFGANFGVTAGYPFFVNARKSITIIPALTTSFGFISKPMGQLENHTTYIQVNNTIFANFENVNVSVNKTDFILRPNVNFFFDLGPKFQIRLSGSYLYDINTNEAIHFSGKDNSGKAIGDDEDVNAPNITYTINGKPSNSIPFSLRGFECTIGFGINLGGSNKK